MDFIEDEFKGIKIVAVSGFPKKVMNWLGIGGFALPGRIYYEANTSDFELGELLLHEGTHQHQIRCMGKWKFYSSYFLMWPILSNIYRYNIEMEAYRVSYIYNIMIKGFSMSSSNRGLMSYTSTFIDYLTSLSKGRLYGWMRKFVPNIKLDKQHMSDLDKCIEQIQGKKVHYNDTYFCKVIKLLKES